jgi:AWS domain
MRSRLSAGKAQQPEEAEEPEMTIPARPRRQSRKPKTADSDSDEVGQKQQTKSPAARRKGKRKAADIDSDTKQAKSPAGRMKGKRAAATAADSDDAAAAGAADSDDAAASDSDADEPRNGKRTAAAAAAAADSEGEACDADADEPVDWSRIFVTRGRSSMKKKEFKLPRSRCGLALGAFPRASDAAQFCVPIEFINERLGATMPEPQYKKLRANAYPDAAMRGIVPASECQPCSCDPGSECGDGCINRCLYQECLPGKCPSLAGSSSSSSKGSKYCANAAIQEKRYPPSEIFRTMDGRGWGLRLCENSGTVQPGTLLKEYMGEVITMDEVRLCHMRACMYNIYTCLKSKLY